MTNGCTNKAAWLLAIAAGLSCSTAAFAQSDSCATATLVTDGVYAYDLAGSTNDGAGSCGATGTAEDRWFAYTAVSAGTLTASTCGLTGGDSVLGFWSGCAEVSCLDDFCGLQTSLSYNIAAGETVQIRIADFAGGTHAGSISIAVAGPGPGNDTCAQAVTAVDGDNAFSTIGFTTDGPDECVEFGFSQVGQDAWFNYTVTGTGLLRVQTCGTAFYDSKIALYSGNAPAACPAFTSAIACNDDTCGLQSRVETPVTIGDQILIRIGGYGAATGSGSFNVSIVEPCEIPQPAGSVLEAELCGEDLNGGCNLVPPLYEAIPCGNTVIYGQGFSSPALRDTDWYQVQTFGTSTITATLTAEFAANAVILSGDCSGLVQEAFDFTSDSCETVTISATVPAGLYVILMSPVDFVANGCETGNNSYVFDISVDGGCVPTGACCAATGCSILSEAECATAQGDYLGDLSTCEEPGNYSLALGSGQFSDIADVGTEILQADDTNVNVPIGFTFNFFGTDYTDAFIGSNGYVSFGAGFNTFFNTAIPSVAIPNNAAYALWDDFNFAASPGAKCYHATLGTAGVDLRFVAQWTNVPQFAADPAVSFNTFQAILYENGNIEYRYGAVDGFPTGDATIGIENADGTVAVSADGDTIGTGGNSYDATFTPGSSNCVGGCASDITDCRADQDGDEDIDSDDINLFFAAFEAGDSCGDQDGDDDVDSDDINIFFAAFENGGCP